MELECDYMSPYTARERNLLYWDLKSVIELISLTLCMLICQCWLKFDNIRDDNLKRVKRQLSLD